MAETPPRASARTSARTSPHAGTGDSRGLPQRVIFRIPVTALLPVIVLVFCATPFAFGAPGLQAVYAIPLALGYWVMRTRTIADPERIVVRTVFGHKRLDWSRVESIRVPERGWVTAVVPGSGREVHLPGVRARHLPALAIVSGGRIHDPTQPGAEEPRPSDTQPERPDTQPVAASERAAEPEPGRPAAADGTSGSSEQPAAQQA